MRKHLLFALIALGLFSACEKSDDAATEIELLTRNKWFLVSATSTAATTGQPTDLMKDDPSTCLNNNFNYKFKKDGTYLAASSGPLCDMVGGAQQYTLLNNSITMGSQTLVITQLSRADLVYTQTVTGSHVATFKFVNKR